MPLSSKKIFDKIYFKYREAIYNYCFFRVYSRSLAEELMQETFMRMWKYLSNGKTIDNPQALLYRIARNLIIDLSRRNNVKKKIESSFDASSSIDEYKLFYDGAAVLEQKVLVGDIHDYIKKLPSDSQDILIMRYVEGLTPKEIAKIYQTNANNISVKIYKAIKKLSKLV